MERFTNILKNKAYLKCSCSDGDYFQRLIEKLAEYEDLDDKGLVKREPEYTFTQINKSKIDGSEILSNLLKEIVMLTKDETELNIAEVLPEYCKGMYLKNDYDGLFWSNEGTTWKYKNDLNVVKLVDTYFVTFRKFYYPELKHKNFNIYINNNWVKSKFPCRYDYLKNKNLH